MIHFGASFLKQRICTDNDQKLYFNCSKRITYNKPAGQGSGGIKGAPGNFLNLFETINKNVLFKDILEKIDYPKEFDNQTTLLFIGNINDLKIVVTKIVNIAIIKLSYGSILKDTVSREKESILPVQHRNDERIPQEILVRRGQKKFRDNLLTAYRSSCAISNCKTVEALEAAHIVPHSENPTYKTNRGILLRADIHTLFDLFLISIDPQNYEVVVASNCIEYNEFSGKKMDLPKDSNSHPDRKALIIHYTKWKKLNPKTVGFCKAVRSVCNGA
jgi:predicted restriction endonuclease